MNIEGNGAPSKLTEGAIGDQYTDSLTGTVYECAYIINTKKYNDTDVEYIWKKVIEEDKDSGSGSEGSTQMQVDWNQNDETAADYVKNRTHYSEDNENGIVAHYDLNSTVKTVVCDAANGVNLEQTEIEFNNNSNPIIYRLTENYNPDIDKDKTYHVLHTDPDNVETEYDLKFEEYNDMLYIGNLYLVIADILYNDERNTGEPFAVCIKNDRVYVYVEMEYLGAGTYADTTDSILVEGFTTTLHTLDEKFLPESVARTEDIPDAQIQADWNQNDETAADYVKGRTHWVESLNIEFDGDITDKVTVGHQEYTTLVKVSEYIDISGVIQMYMEVTDSEGGISNVTIDFSDPANVIVTSFDGGIRVNGIYFVKETGTFNVDGSEYTFPETGVYFNYVTEPVVHWNSLVSLRTVHQLDEKFLPDSVKGMIVVVEDNSESSTGYSANKTYQEILDKVSAGENVYAVYNDMVTHLSAITGLISHMEGISTLVVQNTVAIFRSIDGLYEIVIADDGTVKVNRYSEYATVDDVNELIATALGTNLEELESLVGGGEADE